MRGVWRGSKRGERRAGPVGPTANYCVVDPGASRIRLLLVEVANGRSTLWGWDEGPSLIDGGMQRLLPVCGGMLVRAEEMALARVPRWPLTDQMLVGLPASEMQAGAWAVTQRRALPESPIEEQELWALLGRALRLTINQLRNAAPSGSIPGQGKERSRARKSADWLLVDATTVALEVDGKAVTDPVGFRGREIAAKVFAALARAETIDLWRQVAEGLEFSVLTITAAPMALVSGLSESRGILLDVGGSTTSLTLWQAGKPVAVSSIPVGGAVLTRALMRTWDLTSDSAERLMRAYASGQLTDRDKSQVLEAMFPALRTWLEKTESALARLHREKPLPERLYLLGGGSGLPEVMETACALAWSDGLHFQRYPLVERLRPTDVAGVMNRTELGRGAGDVSALGLAAWAANQSRLQDRPARILRELCEGRGSG